MLLDRKRFGLILRVFSKEPQQVAKKVEQVDAAIQAAACIGLDGKPVFTSCFVLVASDPNFPDCDCGQTKAALEARLQLRPGSNIEVHEVANGDLFCGVLNYGVAKMLRNRIDYVCILSSGASGYLTPEVMRDIMEALDKGAKVAGVAIEELSESILEGRIANTFAVWDAVALMSVGGFDLRAAQPRNNDLTAPYLRGWSQEKGAEVFYPQAGVEEIIPLLRLGRVYGPCIAPIIPQGFEPWRVPDPITDRQGYERHLKKMGTKRERQTAHAAFEHADLSALKGAVMPAHRHFS